MITYIEEYYQYLLKNPEKACHKILVVYKKLVYDIYHSKRISFYNESTEEEEEHNYIFDIEKANKPIEFIEKYCRHSKGRKFAGKPVILELWQKAFVQAIFGFVDEDTGLRKYTKASLFVGRKNGKSTLAAAIGLYMLCADGEGGAECYSVAVKKDQAKIVWDEAKNMIKKSPELRKFIKTLVTGIYFDATSSIFKALASADDSLDGLNGHYFSGDEIHAWKIKNLLDVLYDSMAAREQPLFLETSTMGTIRESVFDDEYEYFSNVLLGYEGLDEGIVDETVLPFIYELDNINEWKNEKNWFKANPGLGTIKTYKFIRDKVLKAENTPKDLANLLCKDFNIAQNSEDKWLSFEIIDNKAKYEIEYLFNTYAIGGVDLSSTTDLTCATLIILKQKVRYVLQQYFIPRDRLELKIKEDKIPYDKWEKRGLITICEGAKVNYSDVTEWFLKMHYEYGISALWVGYDPWNTQYWVEEMKEQGFNMVEVRQGAKTMSNPMKQLEADLIEKNINYNNNPVLKWCLCNTAVKRDENDNIRPVKGKKQRARIDGTVSLIIAYCVLFEKMNDYLALQEE